MKKVILGLLLFVSCLFAGIDLNTASKEELMAIKGIGEKKAMAIIEYRKTNTIKSIDDLLQLKGFGEKLIAKIKPQLQ